MTFWQALFLGIIQGITEFLPVSSSGHLKVAEYFLGFEDLGGYLLFDLICHLGTFFAIIICFKESLLDMFKRTSLERNQIFIATLPLFPLVFLIKPITAIFDQPQFLGFFFLITATFLYLIEKRGFEASSTDLEKRRFKDPLIIGMFQAVACLPGISRSGSTICAARILGWPAKKAASFSFLLALPAILGGICLQFGQLVFKCETPCLPPISFFSYLSAFFASFFVGILSIRLMIRLVVSNCLTGFAIYCLLLGIALIVYFTF